MNKINQQMNQIAPPHFPATVIRRSPITVALGGPRGVEFVYSFTVTLASRSGSTWERKFNGWAYDRGKAMKKAIKRSGRMIEHGYQEGM